jgi:hypothetical protein
MVYQTETCRVLIQNKLNLRHASSWFTIEIRVHYDARTNERQH